jgi:hypothetical protein
MFDVSETAEPIVDIWPLLAELVVQGVIDKFVIEKELVEKVYRSEDGKFDHVIIPTENSYTPLILVINIEQSEPVGYYLLNLKDKYSL